MNDAPDISSEFYDATGMVVGLDMSSVIYSWLVKRENKVAEDMREKAMKLALDTVNGCREDGETDLRCVRDRVVSAIEEIPLPHKQDASPTIE